MTHRRNRFLLWGVLAGLLALALLFAFWPRAALVETATVTRGPMSTTVDEEGETRIRDVYTVYAPIAGDLERIALEPGDVVIAGETIVASLHPGDPEFLTERSQAELQALARAADAAVELAAAEVERTEAELEMAQADLERAENLRVTDVVSQRQLQLAEIDVRGGRAARAAAVAALDMRRAEAERARAALMDPSPDSHVGGVVAGECCVPITAPVSGRVLRVLRESGGLTAAGAPLIEIGDPEDLEVVADLLSTDAVQVREGAEVRIAEWGDAAELMGRVRRVEPYGFTKISALGIEEQRVNVVIDFDSPAEAWAQLGHGFRVEPQIVTWSTDEATIAPLAALFRDDGGWATFVVRNGRARLQIVEVGHRNATEAEILSGLAPGDRVILHPAMEITADVRIKEHDAG